LLLHLTFGVVTSILMWSVVALYRRTETKWIRIRYFVQILTAICVSITGHVGGFVSGVNGGS
jgi:hypothetical protein